MYTEMCAVELYMTISCIYDAIFASSIKMIKVRILPPFLKEKVNFDYLPLRGGRNLKNQKKGWKYAGLLKKRRTDTFPIEFFQGLSFLHLEITLPFVKLSYAFEEKIFFSVTMILRKKVILSCLKRNLEIPNKVR